MLLLILYILIAIFATSAILEAWFHEDGIFESIKNNLSLWLLSYNEPKQLDGPSPEPVTHVVIIKEETGKFLVQLINCRKCLTYWVSAASFLLILISQLSVYTSFVLYIFIILAVTRGVHLIDGYLDEQE